MGKASQDIAPRPMSRICQVWFECSWRGNGGEYCKTASCIQSGSYDLTGKEPEMIDALRREQIEMHLRAKRAVSAWISDLCR